MDSGAWMVLATVATAVVAVYAAILSTINYVADRRDKRPHIKVSLSYGFLTYPADVKGCILIQVSNPGMRPVTIASVALRMPTGHSMFFPRLDGSHQLPTELTPGQGATFWLAPHDVTETLRENGFSGTVSLRAVCRDETDNKFQSRPYRLDLSSKMADEK